MSDETLYYKGWPYNAQPTPDDQRAAEEESVFEKLEREYKERLAQDLRAALGEAVHVGIANPGETVQNLLNRLG